MLNQKSIQMINKNLILPDGKMKPFTMQLLEYEYHLYPDSLPFVVSNTTMCLNGADVPNYPIIINQSTVEKIKNKHNITNSFIMHLEKMLRTNVLVMESRKHRDSLVVITDYFDRNGDRVIITLRKGFRTGHTPTNQISSVYGKRLLKELIEATFDEGLAFYPNKKTRHFITSQRLQLPPDVIRALSYDYITPYEVMCQENSFKKKNSLEEQIFKCGQERNKFSRRGNSIPINTYKHVWEKTK